MRILSVILALVLLALAGLALAPDPLPAPYADQLRAILPTAITGMAPYADEARALLPMAITGMALLLLIAIIAQRPKTTAVVQTTPEQTATAQTATEPVQRPAPEPQDRKADADVVNFLVDFAGKGPPGRLPDG